MGLSGAPLPFLGVLAVALCLAIFEVVYAGQHGMGGGAYLLID